MTAFNPIATMQALRGAGIPAPHAEALADAINAARLDLVTSADLKAELAGLEHRLTVRICGIMGACMAFGFTALGVLISLQG